MGSNKNIEYCHKEILNKVEYINVDDEHIENLIKYLIAKHIMDWSKFHKIRYIQYQKGNTSKQEYFIIYWDLSGFKTIWLLDTNSK